MSRRIALIALLAACESTGGGGSGGPKVAESGTLKGSAGGFSAQMSAELAKAGVGEPSIPIVAPVKGDGAGAGASTTTGSTAAGGSAAATNGTTAAGGSANGSTAEGASGSTTAGASGSMTAGASGSTTAGASGSTTAGTSGSTAAGASGSTAAGATGTAAPGSTTASSGDTKTDPAGGKADGATGSGPAGTSATSMKAVKAVKAPANRSYVKPPADVAAIKFDLEPNWERDMGEAGTFSLVVKIPNTDDTRVFSVRYGYEDASAPLDCDQYRKFLEDRGAMKVTLNRQRGAACYVEGTDQGGLVAYRFLLTYGGKRLMCHGSLYKDKDSAALGDLRDKVLMQAKKICETLAL